MRREVVKKWGVGIAVFLAGAALGVGAGICMAWGFFLNVLAALLVAGG